MPVSHPSARSRLVVNVDTDPDPPAVPQPDEAILAQYTRMRTVLDALGVRAAWSILTAPRCRTRFLEDPYLPFWRAVHADGGDLVLHPEEDLYGPPAHLPQRTPPQSAYADDAHMASVITGAATRLRAAGLEFAALRGGYHGFTPAMGHAALQAGIRIDLACAPGVDWPEKCAAWSEAPTSAYRMHPGHPAQPTDGPMLEIPWARNDGPLRKARPFVVGESFMINEFSTLDAMKAVWATVQARAAATGQDQVVSMITHTFTIDRKECRERLQAILTHVLQTGGQVVTPSQLAPAT